MAKKKTDYEITKPRYLSFWNILFVLSVVGLFIMLRKFVSFHGDMLFWFFASTSQSMAALFAVGGFFAVFRFQAQEVKLRNLYDAYKKWLRDWQPSLFGEGQEFDTEQWKDNQIVDIGKSIVKERRKHVADAKNEGAKIRPGLERLINNLEKRVNEIEHHERKRKAVLEGVKFPMLTILITFMISIGSFPLASYISKNWLGLMILIITLALITFSLMSVYTFIRFSLSFKKEEARTSTPLRPPAQGNPPSS